MTEDEAVGWHRQLDGHDLGQTLGDGEGQGGLECCNPRDHKELDMTRRASLVPQLVKNWPAMQETPV